jgi:antitoxin (DNA-binding transcriptional repressor) of toxin-antitoxin stability system
MPIRELDIGSGLLERAVSEDTVVLTTEGQPFALVVGLREGEDPAELERFVWQARAQCAISAARAAARLNGTDKLTMEEIDAEIRAARAERAARAAR